MGFKLVLLKSILCPHSSITVFYQFLNEANLMPFMGSSPLPNKKNGANIFFNIFVIYFKSFLNFHY